LSSISLLNPLARRELVDGDVCEIVDLETFECQLPDSWFPFNLMDLLPFNIAPSDIVYFDDSKADTQPIEDVFFRWKVGVQDQTFLVR
jgi:hypothetical protein